MTWNQVAPVFFANGVNQTSINSMIVFNNHLYATCFVNTEMSGQLLVWNGVNAWVQVAFGPTPVDVLSNGWGVQNQGSIGTSYAGGNQGMAVFNGNLFGVVDQSNPGGVLFQWDGVSAWVLKANYYLNGAVDNRGMTDLCVFNNQLYGTDAGFGGHLFQWNGTDAWVMVADTYGFKSCARSMCVFNNHLYAIAGQSGHIAGGYLFQWNGTNAWTVAAPIPNGHVGRSSNTLVFNNNLYCVIDGVLFQWNNTNAWVNVAPAQYQYANELFIWNGSLYSCGGTDIYKWNGFNAWVLFDTMPLVVDNLVVFNNTLFASSTGKLYERVPTPALPGIGNLTIVPKGRI